MLGIVVGYNLGSTIVGIAALGGITGGRYHSPSMISRADIRTPRSKEGSESTNIYSVLPALGESTGSGTVTPCRRAELPLDLKSPTSAKGLNKVDVSILTKLNNTSAADKPSTASGIRLTLPGRRRTP